MKEYSKIDHTHCFDQETSPCGIVGKHPCCLCKESIPQETKESWEQEFYKKFDFFECSALNADDIMAFIHSALESQKRELRNEVEKLKNPDRIENGWSIGYNKCLDDILNLLK